MPSQPAAAPTGPDGWPEGLGQLLSGSEQARALGAYNEERFQEHLAQLEGLLTARARARRAAAASSAADVDDLVSAVRMLECKAPPNVVRHDKQLMTQGISGNSECSSPQHLIAAVPAAGLDEVKPAAEQPAAKLAQEGDPVRPFPLARVKPLAQVKFEADSALRALACAPRRFTAPPPPQMTPEPLFERMQAEREQRLADDYTVQLEQLREQECPSSYQQREKAAVAAAGPAAKELASCPNSPTFHAHQVPLSTMEGRYALLVAELQLRGLRPSTAVLLSSNVRGAHLAQQRRRSE